MSKESSNEARVTEFVPLMKRANGTSDCVPTGLVTGPAEALAQLRADLEATRGETAKAQDAYERMADDRDGWRRQYAQSRATEAKLRAEIEELKKRLPTPECRLDEYFSGGCPCDCHPAARASQEPRT